MRLQFYYIKLRPRTQSVTVFSRILIKSRNLKFQQALLQSLVQSTHRNWVYLKRRQHFTVDSICFKMFRWYILTKINVNQVKDTTPFLHVFSRRQYKYYKYQIKPITWEILNLFSNASSHGENAFSISLILGNVIRFVLALSACRSAIKTCSACTVSTVAWTGQQNTAFPSFFSSFFSKKFMVTIPSSVFNTCPRKKDSQLLYATATKWPLDTYIGKQDISS